MIGKNRIIDFGPEIDTGENPNLRDSLDTSLEEFVKKNKTTFTYIFDDRWAHTITLEKRVGEDDIPVCIDGEGMVPNRSDQPLFVNRSFSLDEVNAELLNYYKQWEAIYREAEELYGDEVEGEDGADAYESFKHLRAPVDLLHDEEQREFLQEWLTGVGREEESLEKKTFDRLIKEGFDEEETWTLISAAFSIERFYYLKYGILIVEDRYEQNLAALPNDPIEIPSWETAIDILEDCMMGIPFTAIQYLQNDESAEARTAIIDALKNASGDDDDENIFLSNTPLFYAFAAEGHITEELIDPVTEFLDPANAYTTEMLSEQCQYLIGKLAQQYPDKTMEKVLAVLEQEVRDEKGRAVYYLFDAFSFCDLDRYKDRLIALLRHEEIHFHAALATTIGYLQIKEALPVLREQTARIRERGPADDSRAAADLRELEEAIHQLETGENLYPEVDMPLCLSRSGWFEAHGGLENEFYKDDWDIPDDQPDSHATDYRNGYYDFTSRGEPIKRNKIGRNDLCPCGSGKKYKNCCMNKDQGDRPLLWKA